MRIPLLFNLDYPHCQTRFCCCFSCSCSFSFCRCHLFELSEFLRRRVALDGCFFFFPHFILSECFCLWKSDFWAPAFGFSRGFLNCPHRVTFTSFKCFVQDDRKGGKPWLRFFKIFWRKGLKWAFNRVPLKRCLFGYFPSSRRILTILSSFGKTCFAVVVLCAPLSWLYLNVYKSKFQWVLTALCKLVLPSSCSWCSDRIWWWVKLRC